MKNLPIVIVAMLLASMLQAAPVAAKKDGVQVTSEAKKDSAVLVTLNKGEALEAQVREGMFWKVLTKDGKTGYVSVMNVQRQSGEDTGLASTLREEALKARQDSESGNVSRARSAVMGVRGLDESNDTATASNIRPDLRAVYRMEDREIQRVRIDRLENLISKEIENAAQAKNTN
jgi:uncharacterized protein YgiM (DUF1202 family)